MKFKQILKKVLKYVVTPFALVGSIIGLYSIDSYAYTTDTFSHTLTYNSSSGNYIYFDLNESLNSVDLKNYYLCINLNTSGSGWTSSNLNFYFHDVNINVNRNFSSSGSFKYGLSSCLYPLTNFSYLSSSLSSFYFSLSYSYPSIYLNYSNIVNIDLISQDEITTSYYIDTYVASYQQQLAQLQEDYDNLEIDYQSLNDRYGDLEENYEDLQSDYNTLENEYEQKQNEYDMLTNGQLGYLSYMEFYINNQSIEFGNDSETELNLNELINYNLYSNNSLNLSYFTTQQVNPNYLPLNIVSYYNELPVNLFSMYFNGVTSGIIKVGYYDSSQYILKQISFDNTGTAVDSINSSLINYDVFKGLNVDYIEYIEIQFNNADFIAGSINFNSTYNIAYSSGFTNGYNYGYNVSDNVNIDKINNARQDGYQNGYDVGKQEGIAIGSDENNTLYGVVIRKL